MKIRETQREHHVSLDRKPPSTRTRETERSDTYRGGGTSHIPSSHGQTIPPQIEKALGLHNQGRIADALETLDGVATDRSKSNERRAEAAAWAGLMLRRDRPRRSEEYLEKAEQLAPNESIVQWLKVEVLLDRAQVKEALELTEQLIKERPKDPLAFRARADALLDDAKPEAALVAAERALELAPDHLWAARHRLFLGVGYGAAFANKPKRLVAALEENLRLVPEDYLAHSLLSDFVVPSFSGAHRKRIDAKLDRANSRYQAGDYDAVKKIALEILEIEPKDGLAHALFAIAVKAKQKEKLPLVEAISNHEKRKAAIEQLTELTGRAEINDRPGRPSDLFPDWHMLTETQRATIAVSILPFGVMVPKAIEAKAVYRLALPATSCADRTIDPFANRAEEIGVGRYLYAVRGRARLDDKWVVTGVEEIDRAARGDYNTITHEFAHLVHQMMIDLAGRREREEPLDKTEDTLALASMEIESLFRQARMKRGGELLVDAYSGNNVYEYFAQSLMSYLALSPDGMMTAEKLEARNPAFTRFAVRLCKLISA